MSPEITELLADLDRQVTDLDMATIHTADSLMARNSTFARLRDAGVTQKVIAEHAGITVMGVSKSLAAFDRKAVR